MGFSFAGQSGGFNFAAPMPTFTFPGTYVPAVPPPPPQRLQCGECLAVGSDGHQCSGTTSHVYCKSCFSNPVPVRKNGNVILYNMQLPPGRPMMCEICEERFCSPYFTGGCSGNVKLLALNEHKFRALPPRYLPPREAGLLEAWMTSKNKTAQDVYDAIMAKIADGDEDFVIQDNLFQASLLIDENRMVYPTDNAQDVNEESAVCSTCATVLFKDLIYWYRRKIVPQAEIPNTGNLAECYHGRGCRTQWGGTGHDARFAHIFYHFGAGGRSSNH